MIKYLLSISIAFILSACSGIKKSVGYGKDVPDEFLIKKVDPIERPPNYDLLPPDTKIESNKAKSYSKRNNVKSIVDNSLNSNSSSQERSKNISPKSSTEKMIIDQLGKK